MRLAPTFVLVAVVCPVAVQAGQAEADRFLREYPEAARRIQERYSQIKGECRITDVTSKRMSPAIFAFDHGFRKVEFFADPNAKGRSGSMVYCLGPDSGFGLRRENTKAPYRVFWLGPASENQRTFNFQFGKYINAPHSIYWTPLIDLVKPGDVRNVTAEEVSMGGETLLKVYFESGTKEAPDKTWLVLDPNSWVIRSYENLAGQPPGATRTTKIEVEYDPGRGGIPTPKLVKFTDPNLKSEVCEFRSVTFDPTPRDEFSMEFYDLPDIAATPPVRRFGLIPWLVGLGVLGLVVGLALKLAAGRARARRAMA
ncbi:hypothetical protein [Tautonia sociabilis]|uniref:Uncharacterized protein n=1 Tax=Tautonia sociabilis TaxID=2080755 RepID=A0A432MKZ6_9BACT|nr:hypothetical protein [Tautonia sociabilis]RUL88081.1 hypothetical protein TsocGM_09060 [Tautonia sociabilis]